MFDGSNQNGWTSEAAKCFFGTSFKVGYIGVISEVKYFMSRFNRTNFVDKLRFEGSQDGITYSTIFTVSQEIHEGWNTYNYQGKELRYRFYRFYGPSAGSCIVGELGLKGFEVINNNDSTY